MKVLIAEDDRLLGDGLSRFLRQSGHETDVATNGLQADAMLSTREYDLALLDIGLPGMDGLELLRRVRQRERYLPAVLVTARDSLEDRIHGLNHGADDYLVKPFSLTELEARMRAIVRRSQSLGHTRLSYGVLELDVEGSRAWLGGQPLRLTGREWGVLKFLILRAGKIVSKEQILAGVARPDEEMSYNAIEVHISRLRSKLEPAGIQIHSIRGFGYYLEMDDQAVETSKDELPAA
jgi:two-component system OmpR family response regulator